MDTNQTWINQELKNASCILYTQPQDHGPLLCCEFYSRPSVKCTLSDRKFKSRGVCSFMLWLASTLSQGPCVFGYCHNRDLGLIGTYFKNVPVQMHTASLVTETDSFKTPSKMQIFQISPHMLRMLFSGVSHIVDTESFLHSRVNRKTFKDKRSCDRKKKKYCILEKNIHIHIDKALRWNRDVWAIFSRMCLSVFRKLCNNHHHGNVCVMIFYCLYIFWGIEWNCEPVCTFERGHETQICGYYAAACPLF